MEYWEREAEAAELSWGEAIAAASAFLRALERPDQDRKALREVHTEFAGLTSRVRRLKAT